AASERRLDAEVVEEACRDDEHSHTFGLRSAGEAAIAAGERIEPVERSALRPIPVEVWRCGKRRPPADGGDGPYHRHRPTVRARPRAYGKGRANTVLTTANIRRWAPVPTAGVSTTTAVNPGARRMSLAANRVSVIKISSMETPRGSG